MDNNVLRTIQNTVATIASHEELQQIAALKPCVEVSACNHGPGLSFYNIFGGTPDECQTAMFQVKSKRLMQSQMLD